MGIVGYYLSQVKKRKVSSYLILSRLILSCLLSRSVKVSHLKSGLVYRNGMGGGGKNQGGKRNRLGISQKALLAQSEEHQPSKLRVAGSSPA